MKTREGARIETVRFTDRSNGFYGCTKPGDRAGEYVAAELFDGVLEALLRAELMLRRLDKGEMLEGAEIESWLAFAHAALNQAIPTEPPR
jgi:hypothetical protein